MGILQDIAERKDADAVLREQEERYRNAITGIDGVPYYENCQTGLYEYMDPAIGILTGYTAQEMTHELFKSIVEGIRLFGEMAEMPINEAMSLVRRGSGRP